MAFKSVRNAWQAARDFGFKWTVARLLYELQLRSGHHKRNFPMRSWREEELSFWLKDGLEPENIFEAWLENKPTFFFSHQNKDSIASAIRVLYQNQPEALVSLGNTDIRQPSYFTKTVYEVSYPEVWFTNPALDPEVSVDPEKHWSTYSMYSSEYEDLKFIWETGRFSIIYDLIRAYFLHGNEQAARDYWFLVESWIDHNPPNTGPHWKCGQETSLRLMSWYMGLFAFLESPETSPERFAKLLAAVAVQAERVSKDLKYSYLQHSNHAVSEGLGLYVTGLLFPQLKQAEKWKRTGKKILEERALFLIRPDGTPLQKSHNYLRFILQAYLYVGALADANGESFSTTFKDRLGAALNYLKAVLDEKSGRVPNYGSNDGALIFPVNSCDFTDYRPVVAALHYYLFRERIFEAGPWQEDLVWLFGPKAVSNQTVTSKEITTVPSSAFEEGGIYTVRATDSWVFLHAESFKDRPAHADALHLDLWWKGLNICTDPGTYLYYGHLPWRDAFKHTRYHNTASVDGQDQMERTYRFTWAYWHDCRVNKIWDDPLSKGIEVEHDGYQRLADPVIHRRAVIAVLQDCWIVVDDLLGEKEHDLDLHWLINDFPVIQENYQSGWKNIFTTPKGGYEVGVFCSSEKPADFQLLKGRPEKGMDGLTANYYGVLDKAVSLRLSCRDQLPVRFISCFGPQGWALDLDVSYRQLNLNFNKASMELKLGAIGANPIIQTISRATT